MFSYGRVFNSFDELPGMRGLTTNNLRMFNDALDDDGDIDTSGFDRFGEFMRYMNILGSTESHDLDEAGMDRLMGGRRKNTRGGDPGIPKFTDRLKDAFVDAAKAGREPFENLVPNRLYQLGGRSSKISAAMWEPSINNPFNRTGGVLKIFDNDGATYAYDVPFEVLGELLNADSVTGYWSKNLARGGAHPMEEYNVHGESYKDVAGQKWRDEKRAQIDEMYRMRAKDEAKIAEDRQRQIDEMWAARRSNNIDEVNG